MRHPLMQALLGFLSFAIGASASAYTPDLPLPPPWPRPPERFELHRDGQGRMTSMSLPEGDSVTYRHGKQGRADIKRNHFYDRTRGVRFNPKRFSTLPNGLLSPDRMPMTDEELERLTVRIREKESHARFLEEIVSDYLKPENAQDLSAEASETLVRQLELMEGCAPEAASALKRFARENRIRHSPMLHEAAVADNRRDGAIYLSTQWVRALEGRSDFTPGVRWLQIRDSDDTSMLRRRYFGSSRVSLASLGNPSRTWLFMLGIVHELGHFVQYENLERFNRARDLYTFDLFGLTKIINAQAMYGAVSHGYLKRRDRLQFRMEGWKQSVESGANFFALDALAGCPAKIGGDIAPPWRDEGDDAGAGKSLEALDLH